MLSGMSGYLEIRKIADSCVNLEGAINTLSDLYRGKRRLSGRLVIEHCLETAEIASHYTTDLKYLKAALFHDIYEDFLLSLGDMESFARVHGERVARLVTKLSKRPDIEDRANRNQEYIYRMTRITEEDPWVGVIKIADRFSNLTDIQSLPEEKQRSIAIQTLDFYVPLASRLGLVELVSSMKAITMHHVRRDLKARSCSKRRLQS
jgi:GTP diphosphokinase / guanosine-3',5'-bis(diphosphate) 3'-diphosphatase